MTRSIGHRTWDGRRLFDNPMIAYYCNRPNRFLVRCELDGSTIDAYLPNPGRLLELLLPGRRLYLIKEKVDPGRKTQYTVVAVEKQGLPVMLHTHRTNDVAHYLLEENQIPGLEGTRVSASEVTVGKSRFDFLLKKGREKVLVEVKSCTLFGKHVAMFPDAVTARGTRQMRELASLAERGARCVVLFIVHWPCTRIFMPDYHTDLSFSNTLLEVRCQIQVIPISVEWGSDFSLSGRARLLEIPWDYIEDESKDRGSYLLVLYLPRGQVLSIGRLGKIAFPRGFYVYVGSAMRTLNKRIQRHRRKAKRHHWHIDTLRGVTEFRSVLAIRSSARLECDIAKALGEVAEWGITGFGSTDCTCGTHLFGMSRDPLHQEAFHRTLQYFRMDRYKSAASVSIHHSN